MNIMDKGVCGRNRSVVRASMLAPGDRDDLLIQIIGEMKTEEFGASPEANVLWIDRAQD
jgi:hypothetical protein